MQIRGWGWTWKVQSAAEVCAEGAGGIREDRQLLNSVLMSSQSLVCPATSIFSLLSSQMFISARSLFPSEPLV